MTASIIIIFITYVITIVIIIVIVIAIVIFIVIVKVILIIVTIANIFLFVIPKGSEFMVSVVPIKTRCQSKMVYRNGKIRILSKLTVLFTELNLSTTR